MPRGKRSDYFDYLEYAIVEEVFNMLDTIDTLNLFANIKPKNKKKVISLPFNPIHQMICTGKVVSRKIYDPLRPICTTGLPSTFNKSQIKAVNMALYELFTIIQGPPGTGKTLTIAAIVINWLAPEFFDSSCKILVCAPSNTAADYLAERLYSLLNNKMVRYYPTKREDLFNLTKDNVKPFTLLAAVIADC